MILVEILARNARMYGDDIALIEREPEKGIRRVMTWKEFDVLSNRVANALIKRGITKGDKALLLMMNCLEWLPIYFGILRTGAWVVPLNFRFSAGDIRYCSDIAEGNAIFFGKEFVERINTLTDDMGSIKEFVFVGPRDMRPGYGEQFEDFVETGSTIDPGVSIDLFDGAGLYFTSGTTGDPKPILLTHRNLESACIVENRHHNQTHDDNFLLIPPLYHTGAKMHWFGSFIVGGKAGLY